MKFTIRTKLLIGFTLLLLLSSVIQAFTSNLTNQYITSQINDLQTAQAKKGASEVQNFFAGLSLDNFGLAYLLGRGELSTVSLTKENISPVTNYIIKNKDYIKKITILSPLGKEVISFDATGQVPNEELNYEVFSEPFKSAASGTSAISKVYFVDETRGPYIDMFSPIFANDGKVTGVIKTQVTLDKLRESLSGITIGDEGNLYVVDDEGRLIAHNTQSFVLQRPDLSSRKIIFDLIHNRPVKPGDEIYVNEKKVEVVAKAIKISGYNWVVVFEQPVEQAFGFLAFIGNLFIATLVGSLFFLLLMAFVLSANLTSSIRKLDRSARLLAEGKLDTTIDIKSGDEIETLSHSFAAMVNQLFQREALLQQEKNETETILQSLREGVVVVDQLGKILVFNKSAEKISGFPSATVTGRSIDEVLKFYEGSTLMTFSVYNQQTEAMIKKLHDKGLHLSKQDGQKASLAIRTSPVLFENQKAGFIVTLQDLSREQELEEMKLDFVSMAAHELRTPLTAVRGYASLIKMQNEKNLDDNGKEMINRLVVSSENLGNLIENLLSVSRIERSAFTVDMRPVDLSKTVRNVIDNVRPQAYTKKQTINEYIPDELPVVFADAFRIGQVTLNFIANAVNYTQEGGTITIRAEQIDNDVKISISDNGRGIPKEALQKLFTKFFRVSGSLEQGAKGTGLGLYISKSIIEMHKGKVWVESELGKGSTFAFTIPLASPSEITSYQQSKTSLTPKNGPDMIGKKP